jgi:anti-sigma regulatory factor (Ser/Thr protein kinase)
METNNKFLAELHVPRSPISIIAAQEFFKTLCCNLEISNQISFNMEIAIEESMTNLFEYAMDKGSEELLRVRFEFTEDEIEIIFNAAGRPFNFDKISKYNNENVLEHEDVEGLGLFLLQNLMDSVQWRYLEKQGQELRLIKKLPSAIQFREKVSIENYILSTKNILSSGEELREVIDYRIVRDYDDAFALTSCAYDLYHYEYKDVIYYPNELLSRNQNGLMRSWIAVDKNGVVYGHYALIKSHLEDTIAETGAAFVRPELRKSGVMKELADRLHEDAVKLKLRGLFSLSVTNHIATQKLSERYGRFTVGIRIASSPAVFVEGAKPGDRVTTVLNYHQIAERTSRDIFVPKRYRDIILNAYKALAISVNEKSNPEVSDNKVISEQPFFDTYRDITWNRALISARGGELICQKLQAFTDVLIENGVLCITLSIDIEDPGAPSLAEAAVKAGYFYSGIFPESFAGGRDALQMQLLNNITVDPASINIYQSSGKEIFEFIKNEAAHIFTGCGQ